jgi:hypothetical protein
MVYTKSREGKLLSEQNIVRTKFLFYLVLEIRHTRARDLDTAAKYGLQNFGMRNLDVNNSVFVCTVCTWYGGAL